MRTVGAGVIQWWYTRMDREKRETIVDEYQDDGLCAVEGCDRAGQRQVCLYDYAYHRHGAIHYVNDHPFHPDMTFKAGAWRGICNPHYADMKAGADAVRATRTIA